MFSLLQWLLGAIAALGAEEFNARAIGGIGLLAVGSWLYLHWPLWRLGREVNRFLRQAPDAPVRSLDQLQPLQALFQPLPRLSRAWGLYLRAAGGHDWGQGVPSPVPFFAAERLIETAGHRRMAEAVPGFLTALGILGTFLGLSVGLMDLSLEGLSTPEGLRQTVAPLLGGMQLAFHTSVAGILTSVLWAATDRLMLGWVHSRLGQLHDRLDLIVPPVLETELLHELVRNQQQQMADLQSFMTDTLAPRIAQGVREAVADGLTPQFERTLGALERVGRQVGDEQMAGVQAMADRFLSGLDAALDSRLQDLAQVLQETAQWQRSVRAELETLLTTLGQMAGAQREGLDASARLLAEITRAGAAFAREVEQARQAQERLGQVLDQLGAVQGGIATAWEAANQAGERLAALRQQFDERAAAQMQELQQLWRQAQEQIQGHAADFRAVTGELQGVIGNLQGVAGHLEAAATALQALAGDLRAASGEVRQRLGEDLQAFADRMHQGLGQTFDQFDQHLAGATHHLGAVVAGLRDSLADLPLVLQNLQEELAGATRRFAAAAQEMQGPVAGLPGVVQSLYQQLQAFSRGVQQAGEEMAAALEQLPRRGSGTPQGSATPRGPGGGEEV